MSDELAIYEAAATRVASAQAARSYVDLTALAFGVCVHDFTLGAALTKKERSCVTRVSKKWLVAHGRVTARLVAAQGQVAAGGLAAAEAKVAAVHAELASLKQ